MILAMNTFGVVLSSVVGTIVVGVVLFVAGVMIAEAREERQKKEKLQKKREEQYRQELSEWQDNVWEGVELNKAASRLASALGSSPSSAVEINRLAMCLTVLEDRLNEMSIADPSNELREAFRELQDEVAELRNANH